jgi:hypothetical protein
MTLRLSDLASVAREYANGAEEIAVIVVSRLGEHRRAARAVTEHGGTVIRSFERFDYLRAQLPLDTLDRLRAAAGVEEAVIDGRMGFEEDLGWPLPVWPPIQGAPVAPPTPPPAPTGAPKPQVTPDLLPADNPFTPSRDVGSPQFIAAHPSCDGRGSVIAIIEFLPDPRHELFRGPACDLDGTPCPKLLRFVSAFDPGAGDFDPRCCARMDLVAEVRGEEFEHGGLRYRVPGSGRYRFGTYHPVASVGPGPRFVETTVEVPVLWEERSGRVWLDVDGDRDFAAHRPVRDVNTAWEVFQFPPELVPNPLGLTQAVRIHASQRVITFHPAVLAHTAAVAAVAAGSRLMGGDAHGVAPGAQLVIVQRAGWILDRRDHHEIEAFCVAASQPDVSVICTQQSPHIGYPQDGGSLVARMLDRIAARSGKLVVAACGNLGPASSTLGAELGYGRATLAVGAYAHRDTLNELDYPARLTDPDWVPDFSSRGPAADGAMKPDLLAPGLWLAPEEELPPGAAGLRSYSTPAGYRMVRGTSNAAPALAGVAALVASAAHQSGLPVDGTRLRRALLAGARHIEGFGAHEQGAGLADVAAAWDAYRSLPETVPELEVRAPVAHVGADQLREPRRGRGLFEREDWRPGDHGRRVLQVARLDTGTESLTLRVELRGAVDAFSVPADITIPPSRELVDLAVDVHPPAPGIHSAELRLVDTASGLPVHQTLLTVVAAHDLGAGTLTERRMTGFKGAAWFVRVPADARSLRCAVHPLGGEVSVRLVDPSMHGQLRLGRAGEEGPLSTTIDTPPAGVWEIRVYRDQPSSSDVELQAAAEMSEPEPSRPATEPARLGQAPATRFRPAVIDLDLPEHAHTVTVAARAPDGVELALFVYRWDGERATPVGRARGRTPHVRLDRPPAGSHRILVFAATDLPLEVDVRAGA